MKHDLQGWSALPLEGQIQLYGTNPKAGGYLEGAWDYAARSSDDANGAEGADDCAAFD